MGYEPYDVRPSGLGQSQVTVLASPDVRRKVVSGLLRLPRLSLSRRVRFTNRFTELVTDLPICTLASRDNLASAYQAARG